MRLLLDTHALLWFLADDPKLSATAKAGIEDPALPTGSRDCGKSPAMLEVQFNGLVTGSVE
jgi:hypothetical protein